MLKKIDGLIVERVSRALYLTIDRPADLNRLCPELIDHLGLLFAELREDPEIHVVVISGSGDDFFSMGLLNPAIRASLSKDDVIRLVRRANVVFDAMEALPQIRAGHARSARIVRCPSTCPGVESGRQRGHGCPQGKQKAKIHRPLITARR